MRYRKGMSKRLGMIAGGTGITPMYQLIRAIYEDKTDTTEVSLIYANRSEDDILLRNQLDKFAKANPTKFKAHYVLDHPTDNWKGGRGYVNKDVIQEKLCSPQEDSRVLICGPPGMVNASKKNLVELGFQAPGAVSKMTDQIFRF
jgi:cytochrome-b5 reductase